MSSTDSDPAPYQPGTAASRRDEAGGRRDVAADERDDVADERDEAGDRRDDAAGRRDDLASRRDEAAALRDRAADARDHTAERKDSPLATVLEVLVDLERTRQEAAFDRTRSSADRRAGAMERGASEHDRDTASADRGAGASERTKSEVDRGTALADRGAAADDREVAALDGLTGVYLRAPGRVELEREIARANRTNEPLALAYIDVDGLKATNDTYGHAAGDRVLVAVANAVVSEVRAYDLVVRYGGDEFLCAMPGLDLPAVTDWITRVNATLGATTVTVGLAHLRPDDALDDLIARADAAMLRERSARGAART